jgi:hypothetical protein
MENEDHTHVVYDPDVEERRETRTTYLSFCQDHGCEYAPDIYAHGVGHDKGRILISVSEDRAIKLWGSPKLTMENLKNTIEPKDRYKVVIDGRAEPLQPYQYFSCANKGCYLYFQPHHHTWNVDLDKLNEPIARGRYWQMIEDGMTCRAKTCQHISTHVYSKNE